MTVVTEEVIDDIGSMVARAICIDGRPRMQVDSYDRKDRTAYEPGNTFDVYSVVSWPTRLGAGGAAEVSARSLARLASEYRVPAFPEPGNVDWRVKIARIVEKAGGYLRLNKEDRLVVIRTFASGMPPTMRELHLDDIVAGMKDSVGPDSERLPMSIDDTTPAQLSMYRVSSAFAEYFFSTNKDAFLSAAAISATDKYGINSYSLMVSHNLVDEILILHEQSAVEPFGENREAARQILTKRLEPHPRLVPLQA